MFVHFYCFPCSRLPPSYSYIIPSYNVFHLSYLYLLISYNLLFLAFCFPLLDVYFTLFCFFFSYFFFSLILCVYFFESSTYFVHSYVYFDLSYNKILPFLTLIFFLLPSIYPLLNLFRSFLYTRFSVYFTFALVFHFSLSYIVYNILLNFWKGNFRVRLLCRNWLKAAIRRRTVVLTTEMLS